MQKKQHHPIIFSYVSVRKHKRCGPFMMKTLSNAIVAIMATDGFEESELIEPKKALEAAGAEVHIISEHPGMIKAWKDGNWGKIYPVDKSIHEASQEHYDALILPGGVINSDKLRRNKSAVAFVRSFFKQDKPVAAICHGPWMLAEADVLNGRKMTSFPSIKTDMINAGAAWVDEEVVVSEGLLITSRSPKDLRAFNKQVIETVAEQVHQLSK